SGNVKCPQNKTIKYRFKARIYTLSKTKMKRIAQLLTVALVLGVSTACTGGSNPNNPATETSQSMATEQTQTAQANGFHSFKIESLEGKEIDFSQFKGKKVL